MTAARNGPVNCQINDGRPGSGLWAARSHRQDTDTYMYMGRQIFGEKTVFRTPFREVGSGATCQIAAKQRSTRGTHPPTPVNSVPGALFQRPKRKVQNSRSERRSVPRCSISHPETPFKRRSDDVGEYPTPQNGVLTPLNNVLGPKPRKTAFQDRPTRGNYLQKISPTALNRNTTVRQSNAD